MAFIRWKKNTAGKHLAYLVQAYRGQDGKPKQKVLTYLGDVSALTPEHITRLRTQYPDLQIDWEKIKPAAPRLTDVSTLSDAELLRKMRVLRHERGVDQRKMGWLLRENGAPCCSGSAWDGYLYGREFGALEKALERGEPQDYYLDPEKEIAPALRKAFSQK